ncbi:sensor histidine kinase [Peribacillus simplex]|uniref:Sensor histidine kinase n=2 Tax=Peribacillus simplex TaxID=1478 RepID=A0A223EKD9_9BACI|nr:sensor histidine kinase [Peribacillus simplex]ASS95683.1 two-component sensor histidine kinase [Peribacillus simplex NBRC 15720 = DSM 1321]MEC1396102.1 sensor histidine kinase [Peribacillus simplex]MED3907653.1 sensor histidine kinase [Peribacillus simplex]MED3984512.1 sensor histidine kinase [Peribacillus simplex]MED4094558.1 sensor histidine kinase [Peribacillus simplex]
MSILTRQILTALGVAFVISLILPAAVFFIFPLSDWSLLWEKVVMGLPFVIFLPSLVMTVGLIYGVVSGMFWKRQLERVDEGLYLLEQGRLPSQQETYPVQEMAKMVERMQLIHKQINEQTKLSQKMANEKAIDQEKQIQEIVSQERNRLARELHDSVSQQLFAASMFMSAITESQSDMEKTEMKQFKVVEEMIHQSQLEMRALLLHLRPVALKGKSLHEGMKELLLELAQKVTMDINWKMEPVTLDKGIEDHLFRILQESISNTLRHAKANSLEVLLIVRDGLIILRITDDGIGFNVEESKTGSYGLQNMHERAVELGGTMQLVSVPNKGTKLEVKIPLLNAGGDHDD